jgi:hypothetical protein
MGWPLDIIGQLGMPFLTLEFLAKIRSKGLLAKIGKKGKVDTLISRFQGEL